MGRAPTLEQLERTVVSFVDAGGRQARFVIDRVQNSRCVVSYVFHGQRPVPVRCRVGDRVELGTTSGSGWVHIDATVEAIARSGSIIVAVNNIELVQRRRSYREDVIVPFEMRRDFSDEPRRGRTENLSIGGFASRVTGLPVNEGAEVLVSLQMPEGDELHVVCEKVGGDIRQRFRFLHLDRKMEDRIARLIRSAELERQRAARIRR